MSKRTIRLLVAWALLLMVAAYAFEYWQAGLFGVLLLTGIFAISLPSTAWYVLRLLKQRRDARGG